MKRYNIIRTCLQKILNICIVVVGHNAVFIREEGGGFRFCFSKIGQFRSFHVVLVSSLFCTHKYVDILIIMGTYSLRAITTAWLNECFDPAQ